MERIETFLRRQALFRHNIITEKSKITKPLFGIESEIFRDIHYQALLYYLY